MARLRKPLASCVNGDGRTVQAPSLVLCRECLATLDAKMMALKRALPLTPEEARRDDTAYRENLSNA